MNDSTNSSVRRRFERILIVRLSSLGDVIHALPAAAMLRDAFPHATIGWAIEERWCELLCTLSCPRTGVRSPQRPLIDHIHPVKLKAWRKTLYSPQTWEQIAFGLSDLHAIRYQAAVDLQGAVRSAVLAKWSGAPSVYGAIQPRENIASMWYTREVITRGAHIVEQTCSLAEAVIGERRPIPPAQFPCDPIAESAIDLRLHELGIRDFVMLNPGAGWGAKQWPPERYGEVAKSLAAEGLFPIINYGPGEQALAAAAEAAAGGVAVAISVSISELIALTRRARLFIGGDTGPMHLAAALHVPVVALFGPTDPARNGPYVTRSIVLRHPSSRTSLSHRRQPDPGLLAIPAQEVIAAARHLLGVSHG
jgi:heptosyltransferase-1